MNLYESHFEPNQAKQDYVYDSGNHAADKECPLTKKPN